MGLFRRNKKKKPKCHAWIITKYGIWTDDMFYPPVEIRQPAEFICSICGMVKHRSHQQGPQWYEESWYIGDALKGPFRKNGYPFKELDCFDRIEEIITFDDALKKHNNEVYYCPYCGLQLTQDNECKDHGKIGLIK